MRHKKSTATVLPNSLFARASSLALLCTALLWVSACCGPVVDEDAGTAQDATVAVDSAQADSAHETDAYTPPQPGVITGLIEGPGGAVLAGAEIATVPSSGFAVSGSDGMYRIEGVPVGTYTVEATHRDYETAQREDVVVQAGGTAMVDFRMVPLDSTGSLSGLVSDAESSLAIVGATLVLTPGAQTVITEADGHYQFSGLNPGVYSISLSAEGYEDAESELLQVLARSDTTQNFSLVALPVYDSTCVACHINTVRLLADLEEDPPIEVVVEAGSEGEG